MVFIRCKKIGKGTYGYLVKNHWTSKGSRQKTTAYLGKVIALIPIEEGEYTLFNEYSPFIRHLIEQELVKHGFAKDKKWKKDSIEVDLTQQTVTKGSRAVVLALNEGFLCKHTLQELLAYRPRSDNFEEELATTIITAGIAMPPELFIHLYEAAKHLKTIAPTTKSNGQTSRRHS